MKRTYLLFILFVFVWIDALKSDIFSVPFANNAIYDDYFNGLQIYANWASDQEGPKLSDLQYGSGQQLFFSCLSSSYLTNGFLSIVAQAPFNYSLGISSNTTVISPNNISFFLTSTSFGFGANTSLTNCSNASGSNVLCFNINATNGAFAPGGFCGQEGFQRQPSVQFIIWSAPCLNSSVGDPCIIPGVNLCASNATCQANYLCNGSAVFVQPPVPLANSCWFTTTCDPNTGVFPIQNSSSFTSCSNGHDCIKFETCDGFQNCGSGSFNCTRPNACVDQPLYCNATSSWQCVFSNRPVNTPCTFSGGFTCRKQDTCDGAGSCLEGDPLPPPIPDASCTYPNITCVNGTWIVYNVTDGTPCQEEDKCKLGSCLFGKCVNFVNLNSTLGEISNCLLPACNSTNGQWYTIPADNPGITCQYPNVTNRNSCAIGVCNANSECVFGGLFQCPRLPNSPCFNFVCNDSIAIPNQCQAVPLSNIPCDLDSCHKNGTCRNGSCLNTTAETCNNILFYNPQCSAPVCDNQSGCFLSLFSSNTTCNDQCFVNGTATCLSGFCARGLLTSACSFSSAGIRPEFYFPALHDYHNPFKLL